MTRFIEEYILLALEKSFRDNYSYGLGSLPFRSLGDFLIKSRAVNGPTVYFDVKAQHVSIREHTNEHYKKNNIKQSKSGGTHPNLISYQKAIEFYSDNDKLKDDIGMLFIKYDPVIENGRVTFNVLELSSSSIILLRDFSEKNLSYGNLGKGQIQLSRFNNIELHQRSKNDFISLITELKNRPRKSRKSSKV